MYVNLDEALSGTGQEQGPVELDKLTEDEEIKLELQDIVGLALQAEVGRWYDREPIIGLPHEVREFVGNAVREARNRRATFAAFPEEEKQRQRAEALEELLGTPGFFAVRFDTEEG